MTLHRQDGFLDVVQSRQQSRVLSLGTVLGTDLYEAGGVAAVIIDRPAEDATSRGWRCEGDETGLIADEGSRLGVQPMFADALRLARLTGAAALLVLCQDGAALAEPLNEDRIGIIAGLVPYAADCMTPWAATYDDATRISYGEPMGYDLRPENGGRAISVHETRLIRVPGEPMPRMRLRANRVPWMGRPVLDGDVAEDVARLRRALRWVELLLERKQQAVHKMSGLADALVTPEGTEVVRSRMDLVDAVRNVLNGLTIDAADDYTITDLSLSGVADALREFKVALATDSALQFTVLFGESAKGLNATGEGDLQIHHARIGQLQNRCLRGGIERLTHLMWRQDRLRGQEPPRWRIEFEPLWVESAQTQAATAKAEADARKVNAEAIATVQGIGSATPEETRDHIRALLPELPLEDDMPPADDADDAAA